MEKYKPYIQLMRFDKPIGIYLLLWPTLWGLCLAAEGWPDSKLLVIFITGVVLMRAAGCVINDIADRKIDPHVKRTQHRPLASGKVKTKEALMLFLVLCLLAFLLVLLTNPLTVYLSFIAVLIASIYPFMKRLTHLPQFILGAAFAWSVPMAFAAQTNELPIFCWIVYFAVILWTVAYDTMYAMVDREDDVLVGVKSTAVLFGPYDRLFIAVLQTVTIILLLFLGYYLNFSLWYYFGIIIAAGLFLYQHKLILKRDKAGCFKAFLNNQWVGASIFTGIFLHYLFS